MGQASRALGIVAVVCAAVLWGSTGTIQAILPAGKEPLVVAALRILFGAASLVVLATCSRAGRRGFGHLPVGRIVAAGLTIALYNLFFFAAVLRAGVGIGTAIAIGSAPIWVTAFEVLIRRRFPDRIRLFGQAISITGASVLVFSGGGSGGDATGYLFAILAGASYAAYSLITGGIGTRAPSSSVAAATFSVAALAVLPILFVVPTGWIVGADAWFALIFLGIFSTGLSYAFYTWGLGHVAASTAVTLALVEPLTAWLLAIFVVGEEVTVIRVAGAALLLAGLAIVAIIPARGRVSPSTPRDCAE